MRVHTENKHLAHQEFAEFAEKCFGFELMTAPLMKQ